MDSWESLYLPWYGWGLGVTGGKGNRDGVVDMGGAGLMDMDVMRDMAVWQSIAFIELNLVIWSLQQYSLQ